MELPAIPEPVLPRPDPIETEEVEWFSVEEGEAAPATGFMVTVPDYMDILSNNSEVRRWVREALARLQEYEDRNLNRRKSDNDSN